MNPFTTVSDTASMMATPQLPTSTCRYPFRCGRTPKLRTAATPTAAATGHPARTAAVHAAGRTPGGSVCSTASPSEMGAASSFPIQ